MRYNIELLDEDENILETDLNREIDDSIMKDILYECLYEWIKFSSVKDLKYLKKDTSFELKITTKTQKKFTILAYQDIHENLYCNCSNGCFHCSDLNIQNFM